MYLIIIVYTFSLYYNIFIQLFLYHNYQIYVQNKLKFIIIMYSLLYIDIEYKMEFKNIK